MTEVKEGDRMIHKHLGPGVVKSLKKGYEKEICYFEPDRKEPDHSEVMMVDIGSLKNEAQSPGPPLH